MNEKIYNTMSGTGISSLILGILTITVGVSAGILMLVNAARLLKRRSEVMI